MSNVISPAMAREKLKAEQVTIYTTKKKSQVFSDSVIHI